MAGLAAGEWQGPSRTRRPLPPTALALPARAPCFSARNRPDPEDLKLPQRVEDRAHYSGQHFGAGTAVEDTFMYLPAIFREE